MTPRRTDALSRERIVEAAVRILDEQGESGLTLRAVTDRLATGRGAIYHHVANKDELLAAAADDVIRIGDVPIRELALAVFDAIDAHPWLGAQLAREPAQPAVLRIWKSVGTQLHRLGLTGTALNDAGAALVNYVLGAAAARRAPDEAARRDYLEELAAQWAGSDTDPLVQEAAALLSDHDDRAQFLAGVDIFLRGISG
ncbi:TetR family transcriptional regulator [Paractinoplanes abujensis]|uniref:AcrR family transcriptional regulator n=1 Tax=Paractinoplanes abujensis TaxID=882441 RepID=A0A7W7CZI5_9ACTN|nr:TetR/AcrR family transcriptional regulator [Actinoplanes abujensis]MBB4697562.1 AcrR family transcriptional regulator [Actinoplanes abujensis]GID19948.1 TetR family transcriptional regulator [Actinoplanes abujensis]